MSDLDFSGLSPEMLKQALDGPALPPPEGVDPNFDTPANENAVELASLVICLVFSSAFLFIRIYVKISELKYIHIGDCECYRQTICVRYANYEILDLMILGYVRTPRPPTV